MQRIEQIIRAADLIKKNRPSYQTIIEFYSHVFQAQEKSKQAISLPPVVIEPQLLKMKQENQMPLIDPSQFLIDRAVSRQLFATICSLASEMAPRLSKDAEKLNDALKQGTLDLDALFAAILENRMTVIRELEQALGVPGAHLGMFAYLAMAPSVETCAQQLESYFKDTPEMKKGYCPVCGSHPDMAFLDQEGRRSLKCGFCSHQWDVHRMGCVFCEQGGPESQHYFFNAEEKEYRVYLCDLCHNYIKLVDLRQMEREFYPGLEMVSTLHLDMKAKEKGYVSQAEAGIE